MASKKPAGSSALAVEIENLAEDLLDAADAIERLTRKYSDDVQKILRVQAEQVRALAASPGVQAQTDESDSDD